MVTKSNMTEPEYRELDAVNQSRLKLLLGNNPSVFKHVKEPSLYFEEKHHFTIGNGVDTYLTKGVAEFDKEFYTSTLDKKPTDVIVSIINEVFDKVKEDEGRNKTDFTTFQEEILESVISHEYCPTFKEQTRINKVLEHYQYWDELVNSFGKTILSVEEHTIIMSIASRMKEHIFLNSLETTILFQVALTFEYLGVQCKALLDMVVIDHANKEIHIVDFKTLGSSVFEIEKSVNRNRYDIQAAFYQEALLQNLKQFHANSKEYRIGNCYLIAGSTTNLSEPIVTFLLEEDLIFRGRWGSNNLLIGNNTVKKGLKGFHQLIEDYIYYERNGYIKPKYNYLEDSEDLVLLSLDRDAKIKE